MYLKHLVCRPPGHLANTKAKNVALKFHQVSVLEQITFWLGVQHHIPLIHETNTIQTIGLCLLFNIILIFLSTLWKHSSALNEGWAET